MTETTATAPNGEQFPLPTQQDKAAELQRLQALTATYTYEALTLVDVIVVDVQCDYFKETLGNCR